MKLNILLCLTNDNILGIKNDLFVKLKDDLKYFKRVTMGKPIIMGRKTFESIGRPLPGRTNIVVTRNESYQAEGIKIVHSLKAALELCDAITLIDGSDEAMVIGGAELYKQALPIADYLYLTEVHAEVEGDAFFPEFNRDQWQEIGRENFTAVEPDPYNYSFLVLEKK